MEQDDIFFTTVENPREFRRDLLESSKELITILKDYRMLMNVREEKKEKIRNLREQFDELNRLMSELDQYLPEESMNKLKELVPEPEPEPEPEEPEEEETDESGEEGEGEGDEPDEGEDEEGQEEEGSEEDEPEEEPEDPEIAKLEESLHNIEDKLSQI